MSADKRPANKSVRSARATSPSRPMYSAVKMPWFSILRTWLGLAVYCSWTDSVSARARSSLSCIWSSEIDAAAISASASVISRVIRSISAFSTSSGNEISGNQAGPNGRDCGVPPSTRRGSFRRTLSTQPSIGQKIRAPPVAPLKRHRFDHLSRLNVRIQKPRYRPPSLRMYLHLRH